MIFVDSSKAGHVQLQLAIDSSLIATTTCSPQTALFLPLSRL
jgi:hypothetical protein